MPETEPMPDKEPSQEETDEVMGPQAPEPPKEKARSRKARKSGLNAANEAGNEEAAKIDDEAASSEKPLREEEPEWDRSPGFYRMRTSWNTEDGEVVEQAKRAIDDVIFDLFSNAYAIVNDIYDVVREPMVDEHGTILEDEHGFPRWQRGPYGNPVEDWSRLGYQQRQNFLMSITTGLFNWELMANDVWFESGFARAKFTEVFARAYDAPMTGTIEDRTAAGNMKAAEERYFALFRSAVSKRADAVVRSMTFMALRLRDTMQSN